MAIENLQPLAYTVSTIAFVIGSCSIFLRLYCRWRLRVFGWDDFMAIFLFFVNTMQQVINYVFLHYGCGIHADQLPAGRMAQVTKWLFIEEIYYMFIHWTMKQAFLLFYLRLSPQRGFQIAVYATMGINTAFTIINWLLAFLQCQPMDAMIHPDAYPDAKCWSQYVVMMVPTALNALSDIVILALPIPTVLNLRMSRKRKAAVLGIICFGSLSVVTALCRFSLQYQMATNPDTTYVMGRMIIAAAIEIEIAVVAVNLPALKSLFTKFVGSTAPDYSTNGGHKMSDYKSSNGLKGSGLSSTKKSARSQTLGATLTGSEEDLLRTTGKKEAGNITVTTNVDVASVQYNQGSGDYPTHIGFPASGNMINSINTTP